MGRIAWLVLFFASMAADIFLIISGNENQRWFTKVFLMPLLAGYLISSLPFIKFGAYSPVIAALLFSWLGDVLLMLEPEHNIFFILGLVSFLIAHICYISFFLSIKRNENLRIRWLLVLPVGLYYLTLISILFPHLGSLKIPVIIYGAIISTMLAFALHLAQMKNKNAGMCMMLGAILFIISDSVLAFNKFYQPFYMAGVVTMLTYAIAQLLIVWGVITYMKAA